MSSQLVFRESVVKTEKESELVLLQRTRWVKVRKEPADEIMGLFVLRKLILQTHMRSHPVGLDVRFLVGPFIYFHTPCVRTAKALARLRRCAGWPEASLVAYVIKYHNFMSWLKSDFVCTIKSLSPKSGLKFFTYC